MLRNRTWAASRWRTRSSGCGSEKTSSSRIYSGSGSVSGRYGSLPSIPIVTSHLNPARGHPRPFAPFTKKKSSRFRIALHHFRRQVGCIEDGSGTTCTAKSLERFDGSPPPVQALDRAPGAPVTIDVLYGNVFVQRSASGKVEAQFAPFVYAGHGEKAYADQQLTQNLRVSATAAGGSSSRCGEGGSNGPEPMPTSASRQLRWPAQHVTTARPDQQLDVRVEFVGARRPSA